MTVVELFGIAMTWKHLAAAAASLVLPPMAYLMHSGICQRVRGVICRRPVYGKMRIAYKVTAGEYCAGGGRTEFKELRKVHPNLTTIGVYYDDPIKYDKTSRFLFGVVLSEGEDQADPVLEKKLQQLGYSVMTLPEVATAVQTSFPVKNNCSYGIGSWKAYPVIKRFIQENKLQWNPAVEIYDRDTVYYIIPQSSGEQFCPPEVTYSPAKDKFQ